MDSIQNRAIHGTVCLISSEVVRKCKDRDTHGLKIEEHISIPHKLMCSQSKTFLIDSEEGHIFNNGCNAKKFDQMKFIWKGLG